MNVITLKDYAKQHNISYEAVRQQVVRYANELEGHLIRDGRQQFLDEEAVAFLDAKRQKNPVAIIQQSKDEALEELRQERENLLIKIAAIQDELLKEKDKVQILLDEKREQIALLEAKNDDLSAEKEKQDKLLEEKEKELTEANERIEASNKALTEMLKENEAMKNASFWQRLRGFKKNG